MSSCERSAAPETVFGGGLQMIFSMTSFLTVGQIPPTTETPFYEVRGQGIFFALHSKFREFRKLHNGL